MKFAQTRVAEGSQFEFSAVLAAQAILSCQIRICDWCSRKSFLDRVSVDGLMALAEVDDILFDVLHMEAVKLVSNIRNEHGMDTAWSKLERMGYRVGIALIERCTKESTRFKEELEKMRFLCKEFWSALFCKNIDNLRTNHQGVYVLQDQHFRFLTNISESEQYLQQAQPYLALSCGIIRGALFNLGLNCTVTAEVQVLPACKFQVTMQQ